MMPSLPDNGIKILVADDSLMNQRMLAIFLRKEGTYGGCRRRRRRGGGKRTDGSTLISF
jgi:hypothetical protein